MLAAMRRASSLVSSLAAERRPRNRRGPAQCDTRAHEGDKLAPPHRFLLAETVASQFVIKGNVHRRFARNCGYDTEAIGPTRFLRHRSERLH